MMRVVTTRINTYVLISRSINHSFTRQAPNSLSLCLSVPYCYSALISQQDGGGGVGRENVGQKTAALKIKNNLSLLGLLLFLCNCHCRQSHVTFALIPQISADSICLVGARVLSSGRVDVADVDLDRCIVIRSD